VPSLTLGGQDTRCTRTAHTSVNIHQWHLYMLYPEVYEVLEHAEGSASAGRLHTLSKLYHMKLDQSKTCAFLMRRDTREEVRLAHATH